MSASGLALKMFFVILGVLSVIIVVFIILFGCINKRTPRRDIEPSEPTSGMKNGDKQFNQNYEQNNQPPRRIDIDYLRTKRAVENNGLVSIRKIGKAFSRYYEQNDKLPGRYDWCDRLIGYFEEEGLVNGRAHFRIPQLNQLGAIEYHFAFNKNLSLLSKKGLPGNLVLVFEADGEFNLSGGPELLEKKHAKDRYFSVENRYVYILFLDGTIAKYRLHDGAIALAKKEVYESSPYSSGGYTYDEEENSFSEYRKKGETPYSPLKWK